MDVRTSRWIGLFLCACTGCVPFAKTDPNAPPTPSAGASQPGLQQISHEQLANSPPSKTGLPAQEGVKMEMTTTQIPAFTSVQPHTPPTPSEGKRTFSTETVLKFGQSKEQEAHALKKDPERQYTLRDQARVDYQEVLRRDPKNKDAFLGLGRVYSQLKDKEKIRETFAKALTVYPKDPDIWVEKGNAHKNNKEYAEAVQAMEKALQCQPENREIMKKLGYCLGLAGRMEECFQMLSKAVGAGQANYRVAQFYELNQQLPEARRYCLQALQDQPNLPGAQEMIQRLGASGATTPVGTAAKAPPMAQFNVQ